MPLDSPYRPAIEALVSAAILTLQGYLQVRGVGVVPLRHFSGGTVKSQKWPLICEKVLCAPSQGPSCFYKP